MHLAPFCRAYLIYDTCIKFNFAAVPLLRTKSVTKKQMNKCMAVYKVWAGIKPVTSCTKSQYQNH